MAKVELTRRAFLVQAMALGGVAALAACTPKSAPSDTGGVAKPDAPAAAAEEITLRHYSWWVALNETLPEQYEQLKDLMPNVTIELEETADKTTCYVAGTCADIMYDIDWLFADSGYLVALNDLYERDGLDPAADFYPGLMTVPWKGKYYGVTHMFESCMIFYNKELVKKYWGKDLWEAFPDGNWDYTDMEEVARACTVDETGNGVPDVWGMFWTHNNLYYGMEIGSWTRGGQLFDVENVQYSLTNPGTREAARWLLDAVKGPDPFLVGMEDYAELTQAASVSFPFLAQKTALRVRMCTDAAVILKTIGPGDGSEGFEWDMFHLPNYGDQQAVTRAGGKAQTISATTDHVEECWTVIREMGTTLGGKHVAKHKLFLPVYRANPELKDLYCVGVPEHDRVVYDCLDKKGGYGDHMRHFNSTEVWNIYQKANEELYSLPYEEAVAQQGAMLERCEKEMNELVDYGDKANKPFEGVVHPFNQSA